MEGLQWGRHGRVVRDRVHNPVPAVRPHPYGPERAHGAGEQATTTKTNYCTQIQQFLLLLS